MVADYFNLGALSAILSENADNFGALHLQWLQIILILEHNICNGRRLF
jgi:hypothetical protein